MYFERVLDQYYDTKPAIEAQLRIAEVQAKRGKTKEAGEAIGKFDSKYLDQANYEKLVAALLDHRFNPECPASAVKLAIGELLNVWPVSLQTQEPHWCDE